MVVSWSVCAAIALTFVQLSIAAPAGSSAHIVKESVHPPPGWSCGGSPNPEHPIKLRIALPQPNAHVLEQHLLEVSDPDHARYGDHLSVEEIHDLMAPAGDNVRAVDEWITSHGLDPNSVTRSQAKDWVAITVPVSQAEKMLMTKYQIWTHDRSGEALVRTLNYSLPEEVHSHIDLIQPTTMFTRARPQKTTFHWMLSEATETAADAPAIKLPSGITVDASCNTTITVSCLKQLYNAVGFTPSAKVGNQIGITGYLNQNANIADLQAFFAEQAPQAVNSTFKTFLINGGQNSQNVSQAGGEANLDTQFAFGIAFPTPQVFYSTGGSPPFIPDDVTPTDSNEPYTEWLDFILSHPNPPQTISTSYGDSEQTVPVSFAQRACTGFAALGARGVSLLFSSGDGGVGDGETNPATQECFSNDGRNVTRFLPTFPATCPFVTGVGATVNIPEIAVDFSGGGFSNTFSRPSYQDEAVSKFLKKLPKGKFAGLFNPQGRGFPDVAAQGLRFRIFFRGKPASIGGTSAASPSFAGIVSLLNSVRLSHGLPPLGFLNPFLYKRGLSGLTDITAGNNPGCGTEGFNATVGWDPVTGLGTPNFQKLKALIV